MQSASTGDLDIWISNDPENAARMVEVISEQAEGLLLVWWQAGSSRYYSSR